MRVLGQRCRALDRPEPAVDGREVEAEIKAEHLLEQYDGPPLIERPRRERAHIGEGVVSTQQRREDEHDRRMKRVSITADGRDVAQRLWAARIVGIEEVAAALTDEQRAALHGALVDIAS